MSKSIHASRFDLANGWTVSFCPDVQPAICSVAAWPTNTETEWFLFADGGRDKRCYCGQDVVEAIAEIAAVKPKTAAGDLFS